MSSHPPASRRANVRADTSETSVEGAAASRRAYDLLLDRFGPAKGAQKRLAIAAGRDQTTVSKWAVRGVPLEAADAIATGAQAAGIDLSFEEVARWIRADKRAARRGDI